ncbi:MAG: lycopene cyclase family protein [Polyangiales bacterium]
MDADCIVAGAGCGGLSLAVAWLERRPERGRMILLDPRTEWVRDRTWCGFRLEHHPFERCVSHRWAQWRVRAPGREVVRGSEAHPYEHIPADAFYDEALRRIAGSDRVELRRGVHVERIEDRGDHAVARTDAGELRAAAVFDARPPPAPDAPAAHGETRLWQHFVGWEIQTERPVLDPHVATLMDFDVDPSRGIHFVYALPFGPQRALIEDTYFTPERRFESAVYEAQIESWIDRRLGDAGWRIERRERGALPMTTEPFEPQPSPRVLHLGLAGGAAKPSTGYAFQFIQRHSAALAARLEPGRAPQAPPPHPPHSALLDRVFLSWIAREPERAPDAFVDLFEHVPPDAVARFLGESASAADHARVLAALPALPLSARALRELVRLLRASAGRAQSP